MTEWHYPYFANCSFPLTNSKFASDHRQLDKTCNLISPLPNWMTPYTNMPYEANIGHYDFSGAKKPPSYRNYDKSHRSIQVKVSPGPVGLGKMDPVSYQIVNKIVCENNGVINEGTFDYNDANLVNLRNEQICIYDAKLVNLMDKDRMKKWYVVYVFVVCCGGDVKEYKCRNNCRLFRILEPNFP
ncbi:hypothetical protein WA026_005019 [Henosepilachna vigintioctopunctata]|uniref:Uncharacterized protein n=1 Tax=Henosepilachna vigintioctopunctata TaxID=420089 RepID=A0AAW1UKE5_9CUCU